MPPRKDGAASGGAGPSDGLTGASGAAADGPAAKLPVLDEPVFTSFGGADSDEPAHSGSGSASRGGGSGAAGSKAQGGAPHAPPAGEGGLAGAESEPPPSARLIFSEYVEGSGSFKALELYALEGGSLEGCELQTYFNGKLEPTSLALHGQLAQGETQVLCSKSLLESPASSCDTKANLTFNGDDALALSCAGITQDIIGQIGVDPGSSWGVGATIDHTLQRRCSVTVGRTDNQQPFDIDAEWTTYGTDTFSDLGQRSCNEPTPLTDSKR